MTDQTALYSKLAQVIAEVGAVAKDGENTFQNYKYTSAEAMLTALRGPLSSRGIVLMPALTALSEREYTTSKGKASVITTAHVTFTLVDGETGERHECAWAGQGDDPGDKGLGKAYTNAIKTFLREQFLIPQGDDPEADPKTDERASERSRQASSGQSNGSGDPTPTADLASPEDRTELITAAKGLTAKQIRLVLASQGVRAPSDIARAFDAIPAVKSASLVRALVAVERDS